MIVGVGMDIIDIDRITQAYERNNQFVNRILTGVELDMFNQLENRRQMEFLAGRFAAKEAYSKAVGTGIGKLRFTDMEVGKGERGEPVWQQPIPPQCRVHLSITHTKSVAAAQVIIEERQP